MTNEKKSLAAWFEEKYGKRPSATDPSPAPTVAEMAPTPASAASLESAQESNPAIPSPAAEPNAASTARPESAPETVLDPGPAEPESAEPSCPEPAPETTTAAADTENPASVSEEAKPASLYEQLGGRPAVDAAVDIFYRKVLADGRISHFFDDVDMEKQAAKQKAFLTMVFGGPHQYTGKDMREAHAHLANRSWKNYGLARQLQTQRKRGGKGKVERGLKDSHFDAVLENLRNTLAEMGVAEPLIAEVTAIAESTRNDVLGR